MENGPLVSIVATECPSDQEAKFNKWYNEVHIPMLLKCDGMLGVTRYRVLGGPGGQAKYLAVYEFKDQASLDAFPGSSEFAAARDEMAQTWKEKSFDIKWAANYEPLKTWKK